MGDAKTHTPSISSCRLGAKTYRPLKLMPKEILQSKAVDKIGRKQAKTVHGLRRMHSILAVLPRARRQQAIVQLPESVRRALIRYIEVEEPLVASCASVSTKRMSLAPAPQVQACHIVGRSCIGSLRQCSVSRRRSVDSGGICAVRTGTRTQYFARITIDGIAISSRCTLRRDQACMLRGLLVRVSARKPSTVSDTTNIDWLSSAFTEVVGSSAYVEEPGVVLPMDSMWSFRVLVDARKWTGRVISTHSVGSIGKALALRERLEEACLRGWSALRVVLKDYLPRKRPGRSQGRGTDNSIMTSHSRLIFLDNCYAATQKRRHLSWISATSLAAAKISRLSEHRSARLECNLARLATKLARQVADEQKPKKRAQLHKGGPTSVFREPLLEITGKYNLKATDDDRKNFGNHRERLDVMLRKGDSVWDRGGENGAGLFW